MNCQRTTSLLSAFLDGELPGEEMLLIRQHVYSCNSCNDELVSLQVVKRLLGSLDSVEADSSWQANLTTCAYVGGRPWWERKIQVESINYLLDTIGGDHSLSPRGMRMVRVLALSAVVVFMAASHSARYDRSAINVTGNIAANMGMPNLVWPLHTGLVQRFNMLQSPDVSRPDMLETSYDSQPPSDLRQVSDLLQNSYQSISPGNSLRLTVSEPR